MEIVLKNVSYRYKNQRILEKINLKISHNRITGITGNNKTVLSELIDAVMPPSSGQIIVDGNPISRENLKQIRKDICLIRQNWFYQFVTDNVKDEIDFLIARLGYKHKAINEKISQSLKMVGLNDEYLKRNVSTLSSGEKKLIQIAVSLIYNPKVIIFDEPFVELDYNNQKRIIKLIKALKTKYDKTIILTTNDPNILYELTDDIIILKKNRLIAADTTIKVYQDIEFLQTNGIDIPDLSLFTYKARQKHIKLTYHRDILDLIKDVYKHV